MKIYVLIMLTICFAYSTHAQSVAKERSYKIIRSNVGVGGSTQSISTSKGQYTISQSIGQSSVIGTHSSNGYYLRQGYQQPFNLKLTKKSINNNLIATIHPNPFGELVSVSFDELMKKDISVLVYDVSGKLIYSKVFPPSKRIELNLSNLSTGTYLLKAFTNGKLFNGKLIKI